MDCVGCERSRFSPVHADSGEQSQGAQQQCWSRDVFSQLKLEFSDKNPSWSKSTEVQCLAGMALILCEVFGPHPVEVVAMEDGECGEQLSASWMKPNWRLVGDTPHISLYAYSDVFFSSFE